MVQEPHISVLCLPCSWLSPAWVSLLSPLMFGCWRALWMLQGRGVAQRCYGVQGRHKDLQGLWMGDRDSAGTYLEEAMVRPAVS